MRRFHRRKGKPPPHKTKLTRPSTFSDGRRADADLSRGWPLRWRRKRRRRALGKSGRGAGGPWGRSRSRSADGSPGRPRPGTTQTHTHLALLESSVCTHAACEGLKDLQFFLPLGVFLGVFPCLS